MTNKAFTFAHGVDPASGKITDIWSGICGESVKERVLVYPYGKGSTTGAAWFLETVRMGNAPSAILTQHPEPIIVTGSILAKILYGKTIPILSSFMSDITSLIVTGDLVSVDGFSGEVRVRRLDEHRS